MTRESDTYRPTSRQSTCQNRQPDIRRSRIAISRCLGIYRPQIGSLAGIVKPPARSSQGRQVPEKRAITRYLTDHTEEALQTYKLSVGLLLHLIGQLRKLLSNVSSDVTIALEYVIIRITSLLAQLSASDWCAQQSASDWCALREAQYKNSGGRDLAQWLCQEHSSQSFDISDTVRSSIYNLC